MEIDILEKNIDHNNNDFIEGITQMAMVDLR